MNHDHFPLPQEVLYRKNRKVIARFGERENRRQRMKAQ